GMGWSQTVNLTVQTTPSTGLATSVNSTGVTSPTGIVAGYFDGDTNADVVAVGSTGTQRPLLGNGAGRFTAESISFASATAVGSGDFDGDGVADLALGSDTGVDLYKGVGDGTFQYMATYPTINSVSSLGVGDFDGDGIADFVASCGAVSHIAVFLS